jgi:hypothetical protein
MLTKSSNIHLDDWNDPECIPEVVDIGPPHLNTTIKLGGVAFFFPNAATALATLDRARVAVEKYVEAHRGKAVDIGIDRLAK